MARTSQEDLDKMGFGRAFNTRRDELGGSGKTFTWRGNRYTTDLAEETPRRADRSTTEVARSASAAIDRAEDERRPRPNPRRGMTESPRPQANPRRSDVATSISTPSITAEPISRNRRDPQDASPTTRARAPVRRDAQDMPPSISRVIASAPDAAARADAERVAREGLDKRMPLQSLLRRIRDSIRTRREGASSTNAASRSEAAAAAASARREAAQAGRERRAAGMARGGMVKSGNTDRRGNGMFYDSKSPRGYK